MPVYVDDMWKYPAGQYANMKMSHMIATSTDELLAMADRIGVQRRWIQNKGEPGEHFDIAHGKRRLAVSYGAIEITWRECSAMTACRRLGKPMGEPHTAVERMQRYKQEAAHESDASFMSRLMDDVGSN